MITPLLSIAKPSWWNIPFSNILVKDEFAHKYGTVKDRRSHFILGEAERYHVDKLVMITSGNSGNSLARLAKDLYLPLKVVVIVDKKIDPELLSLMQKTCYRVIITDLLEKIYRPEDVIANAREYDNEVIWDVTNGFEEANQPILRETIAQLENMPDAIVVPVGSGGIFCGLAELVQQKKFKTKIIGIGAENKQKSFADKLSTPWTPYQKIMERFTAQGHILYRISEQIIRETFQQWKNIVNCEPSSSIVFAAPHIHTFGKKETVVFLNTGKLRTQEFFAPAQAMRIQTSSSKKSMQTMRREI